MIRALGIWLLLMTAAAGAEALRVPSGQPVHLQGILLDENPGALWLRLRFVAPQIAAVSEDFDLVGADMDHLCEAIGLPLIHAEQIAPARIVISLADREIEFGQRDPEVMQLFAEYRPEGERCIWEAF